MELFAASRQWSERPDDERFSTLEEMYEACKAYAERSAESTVPFSALRVEALEGEVMLSGRAGIPARMTNWAFRQLSAKAEAPATYLQSLPATLAAQNINFGLKNRSEELSDAKALYHFDESNIVTVRSLTTEKYVRIYNHEIISRLFNLTDDGWRVPPARPAFSGQKGTRPATIEDVLSGSKFGLSINVGDIIAPAGLYASDHDMFVFLVNEDKRIDDGTPEGLSRGVFIENSEVGAKSVRRTTFLYRHVCGNHIVWDASNVKKISLRHVGEVRNKFMSLEAELETYANSSASDEEARIQELRVKQIAATKDEVLDFLFGKRVASRKLLEKAYDKADEFSDVDGSPRTAYGMINGITRVSQESKYADERAEADGATAKIINIWF